MFFVCVLNGPGSVSRIRGTLSAKRRIRVFNWTRDQNGN